ncbi:MAG: methionyl-tRNA formyltransferase [Lachnospiraceae bacterium]|nr:methionyl-tRNA formyltransferase [Lachnospiraceae bacterium]
MRIMFMGTPDFAVSTLEEISKTNHEVVAVVTQPDKPKGRSGKLVYTPVKEKALELGVKVYQPTRVKDDSFMEILEEINPELIVVVAFGQILPKRVLDYPKYGCINVHASILPKYRGSAPIQWAVIDGEKETGVTIMKMDEGVDTGDIIDVATIKLDRKETGGSLFDKLSVLGGKLLADNLENIEKGNIHPVKQDETLATHAGMLSKDMGNINFKESDAAAIERLIRGLNPWPSAFTTLAGKTLKIWDADVLDIDSEEVPGTIFEITKKDFLVATKKGTLRVNEVQLEGKKRMKSADFLRGYQLQKGTILGEL